MLYAREFRTQVTYEDATQMDGETKHVRSTLKPLVYQRYMVDTDSYSMTMVADTEQAVVEQLIKLDMEPDSAMITVLDEGYILASEIEELLDGQVSKWALEELAAKDDCFIQQYEKEVRQEDRVERLNPAFCAHTALSETRNPLIYDSTLLQNQTQMHEVITITQWVESNDSLGRQTWDLQTTQVDAWDEVIWESNASTLAPDDLPTSRYTNYSHYDSE